MLFADASGLGLDGKEGDIVREGKYRWNHIKGGNVVTHWGSAEWLPNDEIGVGRWDYSGWPHWHRKTSFPAINYLLSLQ